MNFLFKIMNDSLQLVKAVDKIQQKIMQQGWTWQEKKQISTQITTIFYKEEIKLKHIWHKITP